MMKIGFFITPQAPVAWVSTAVYTGILGLTPEGQYYSTLTEVDLLWFMK